MFKQRYKESDLDFKKIHILINKLGKKLLLLCAIETST